MKKYIDIKNFEELINLEHGKIGSESRMEFEKKNNVCLFERTKFEGKN